MVSAAPGLTAAEVGWSATMARAREATGGAILNGGGKICVGRKREQRERERKKRARALSLSVACARARHVERRWTG